MRGRLRLAAALLGIAGALAAQAAPIAASTHATLLPDCKERTACLCPWRGLLSLADFQPIDPARVPAQALSQPGLHACDWHLIEQADGLRIFHTRPDYRRDNQVLPWNPAESQQPWNERGARRVVAVDDGFIVARNAGEWGADVWWLSRDRQRHERLSDAHVNELIATPRGVIALTTEEPREYGRPLDGAVQRLRRGADGRWRVEQIAALEAPATAALLQADGSLLVVNSLGLLRVSSRGHTQVLHQGRWSQLIKVHDGIDFLQALEANTLAMRPDGEILIAMTGVLVRLTPGPDGYTETWLSPARPPDKPLKTPR